MYAADGNALGNALGNVLGNALGEIRMIGNLKVISRPSDVLLVASYRLLST